jgi:hypothetical protein
MKETTILREVEKVEILTLQDNFIEITATDNSAIILPGTLIPTPRIMSDKGSGDGLSICPLAEHYSHPDFYTTRNRYR